MSTSSNSKEKNSLLNDALSTKQDTANSLFPSVPSDFICLNYDKYSEAAKAAYVEIQRAAKKHPNAFPFRSTHEAYGVLKEEVDEMWDEIKFNNKELMVYEAVQVAAMALRIVAEFGTPPFTKPTKTLKSE